MKISDKIKRIQNTLPKGFKENEQCLLEALYAEAGIFHAFFGHRLSRSQQAKRRRIRSAIEKLKGGKP